MPFGLLLLIVSCIGCAPPSLTLGVSYGWRHGFSEDAQRAHARTRAVLFVRVGAELKAPAKRAALAHEALEAVALEARAPCAIAAACAWEHAEVEAARALWRTP